jgi:hypothetical protein
MKLNTYFIRATTIFLLSALSLNGFSQAKELEIFKQSIIHYNEYAAGKAAEAGHKKQSAEEYRSNIDKAFRDFILIKNSENHELFKSFDGGVKEFSLDNTVLVHVKLFELDTAPYAVYSFKSFVATDYYIKDIANNKIVYHNNQSVPYVDAVYSIDKSHMLIIEKYDDVYTGRRAFVVKAGKKGWEKINAFEGNELIYLNEKQFKKERPYLLVNCSFETSLNAPRNGSQISFDPTTKTISYKTYENARLPQTVRAEWKDNRFIIDDYDLEEHILTYPSPAAP